MLCLYLIFVLKDLVLNILDNSFRTVVTVKVNVEQNAQDTFAQFTLSGDTDGGKGLSLISKALKLHN